MNYSGNRAAPPAPQITPPIPTAPHHDYITAVRSSPILPAAGCQIQPLCNGRIGAVLDYYSTARDTRGTAWNTTDATGADRTAAAVVSVRLEWDNRRGWCHLRSGPGGQAQPLAVPLLAAPGSVAVLADELLADSGNPPPSSQERWKHAHDQGRFLGRLDVADALMARGWRRTSPPDQPLVLYRHGARWRLAPGPGAWCRSQLTAGGTTVHFADTIQAHSIIERCQVEAARGRPVEARP